MTPLQALTAVKKALNIEWGSDTCENDLKPEIDLLTSLVTIYPLYQEAYEILKRNFGVQMPLGDRLRLQELEAKIESL